jgi:subtilisin family serine protease
MTVMPGAAASLDSVPGSSSKVHPALKQAMSGDVTATAWVFFTDKAAPDVPAALDGLEQTYDQRAIERRRLRRTAPGLFDERDLPVADAYVRAVRGTGAEVRTVSRWLNAMSVEANARQIERIAALPFVRGAQPVRRLRTAPPVDAGARTEAPGDGGFYGPAEAQLAQIRLIDLHNEGYTGDGVFIGVLDTGFRRTHNAYNHFSHPLQVVTEYDFLNDDPNTAPETGDLPNQHEHGTFILGSMGAYLPFGLVGGAYDASFILAKVEDVAGEYSAEEDMFAAGLEFIEANGGDVATSSVVIFDHYTQQQLDGMTSVMTLAFNAATDNGIHCFQGAGNEGHDADPNTSHLLPPSDAFDVVSVGAVDVSDGIASFSSDGPTADGRVKPELLTRGVQTWTTDPNSDTALAAPSGTSLATPLAASVAACLVQAHPDWTVQEMRTALFSTATDYVESCTYDPIYVRGYGIADALAALTADTSLEDCNTNAIYDDCDISTGASLDRDANGRPDECENVILPISFAATFGAHRAGGLDDLFDSDDAHVVIEQRPAFSPLLPLIRMEVAGVAIIWPVSELVARIEASVDSLPGQPLQRLSLFDFVAGEYVIIDERTATPDDSVVHVTITDDPSRFITPGASRTTMRIEWFDPGAVFSPNWASFTDQAIWAITP